MNPQPDRYERPALTIELQAPPRCHDRPRRAGCTGYEPDLQGSDRGQRRPGQRQRPCGCSDRASSRITLSSILSPSSSCSVLGIEGGLGGCRRLSPPGRARLDLAIAVIEGVEQAGEGGIRDLHLRHGRPTGEGEGAEPIARIRTDLGPKPGRRLELVGGLVMLERNADQIEWRRSDDTLDGGGMRADIDGGAQIFDLSGSQREQGFGLRQRKSQPRPRPGLSRNARRGSDGRHHLSPARGCSGQAARESSPAGRARRPCPVRSAGPGPGTAKTCGWNSSVSASQQETGASE